MRKSGPYISKARQRMQSIFPPRGNWRTSDHITGRSLAHGHKARRKATSNSPGINVDMLPANAGRMVAILICAASVSAFTGSEPKGREPKSDKGKQLFLDACTACHTLERVKTQRLTAQEWRQV